MVSTKKKLLRSQTSNATKSPFDPKKKLFQEFMNIALSETKPLSPKKDLETMHQTTQPHPEAVQRLCNTKTSSPFLTLFCLIFGSFGRKYCKTDSQCGKF